MRVWLMAMAVLAGCLHAQAPATARPPTDHSVLSEFYRLVSDAGRIEDAATYAAEHRLSRKEIVSGAARAYAAFMRMEAYPQAAEVAWSFGLGQDAIGPPAAFQRKRASERAARYVARRNEPDSGGLRLDAERELRDEALVGCFYSSDRDDARAAVDDAITFRATVFDDDVLFPLLTAGCPVDAPWRDLIIDLAFTRGKDAYAIRHAAEADWTPETRIRFVWGYFNAPRCGAGIRAATALRLPSAEVVPMIESSVCEQVNIPTDGWVLRTDDAGAYFFAAVRKDKFNLALALLPFCGFDANGQLYLFQEALRHGHGPELAKMLPFHPGYHDAFMQYAFDQGRYRFVGMYAQTYDWEEKAFDKLVETGRYDFAAEVAQYGFSETMRTAGIVKAFQAAMKAGDFKMGRYFVARYGPVKDKPGLVTQEMFDAEQEKWFEAKKAADGGQPAAEPPKAKRKSRRQRQKPQACPSDDWCVGDGK